MSQIRSRARFDLLRYAQVWEDPLVLRRALRIVPGERVFSIGAAGDNALALLLESPERVVALDFNPVQIALTQLKAAALRQLDHADLLRFLGVTPGIDRQRLYQALRNQLPAEARSYWDAHIPLVERGIIHGGRFERYLALIRRWILPLTQPPRTVQQFLTCASADAQRELWQHTWNNWRWRLLLRLVFSRALLGQLGRDPAFFKFVAMHDVGNYFLQTANRCVALLPVANNYFIEYILTGCYSGRHGLPPYLEQANHARLRECLPALQLVHASMEDYFARPDTPAFDAFNLSDCFEWMSAAAAEQLLQAVLARARPGARLCYWNLLVPRRRPATLSEQLVAEQTLANELHAIDRAFFYRDVVVERVAQPHATAGAP